MTGMTKDFKRFYCERLECIQLRRDIDHLYDLLSKLWMERRAGAPPMSPDEEAQVKKALHLSIEEESKP
jgi:hypothetical protein